MKTETGSELAGSASIEKRTANAGEENQGWPVGWRLGIFYAASAALVYTATNALMRQLATDVDPWLPAGMRALVTLLFYLPIIAWFGYRGQKIFPGWSPLLRLAAVSLVSQLAGNVLLQYSMGVLGVALAIPLCTGAMVIAAALFGRVFLNEPLDGSLMTALAVLTVSIFLFQNQSEAAVESMATKRLDLLQGWSALGGVMGAIIPGVAFAALSVTIRTALSTKASRITPIVTVCLVGVVAICPVALIRLGPGIYDVAFSHWKMMLFAGLGNAIAFLFLTASLKLLPVAWVNAVNVLQVALAAGMGIVFFGEPSSYWLWTGLIIMTVGFCLLFRRGSKGSSPAQSGGVGETTPGNSQAFD